MKKTITASQPIEFIPVVISISVNNGDNEYIGVDIHYDKRKEGNYVIRIEHNHTLLREVSVDKLEDRDSILGLIDTFFSTGAHLAERFKPGIFQKKSKVEK